MEQKVGFLFNSSYRYLVKKGFDKLITFPKFSAQYQFVLSNVSRIRLMFLLLDEEILELGLLNFFLGCW